MEDTKKLEGQSSEYLEKQIHNYEEKHKEVQQKLLVLKVKRTSVEDAKVDLKEKILKLMPAIPEETQKKIKDLETKEGEVIESLLKEEADLAIQIKNLIMELGITVGLEDKSAMAIYKKGIWKWNNDKLEGMAILQPGILQARTQGKSSVSIKINK